MLRLPGLRVGADHPFCRGVMDDADAVGVGDADRSDEIAAVMDPVGPRHLAIAVQRVHAGPDRFRVWLSAERQDCGHAGAHGALALNQRTVAFDARAKPDFDAGHVGDRVVGPRLAWKGQTKIAAAGLFIRDSPSPDPVEMHQVATARSKAWPHTVKPGANGPSPWGDHVTFCA